MSDLQTTSVDEIVAACRAGLAETAQALGRAFDAVFRADVGEQIALDTNDPDFVGPGLLVLLGVGASAALVAIPESSGLLPEWVARPDADGTAKLNTLAQELGRLLLPATLAIDDYRAARVDDLSAALFTASPSDAARWIPLLLHTDDGRSGVMSLCTPFGVGPQAFSPAEDAAAEGAETSRERPAGVLRGAEADAAIAAEQQRQMKGLEALPSYSRSLLKVRVPVMVVLARKKQRISQIIELGPGSIIQFSKACDQLLELEVNGHAVGEGEAVKVGEKFGLRVTGMILPGEKFKPVTAKRTA